MPFFTVSAKKLTVNNFQFPKPFFRRCFMDFIGAHWWLWLVIAIVSIVALIFSFARGISSPQKVVTSCLKYSPPGL